LGMGVTLKKKVVGGVPKTNAREGGVSQLYPRERRKWCKKKESH